MITGWKLIVIDMLVNFSSFAATFALFYFLLEAPQWAAIGAGLVASSYVYNKMHP